MVPPPPHLRRLIRRGMAEVVATAMLPATPAMVALAINVAAAAVVVRLLMDRRLGMVVTEGMVFL